eukprot:9504167-Pyramimonas_sp.AAC.5
MQLNRLKEEELQRQEWLWEHRDQVRGPNAPFHSLSLEDLLAYTASPDPSRSRSAHPWDQYGEGLVDGVDDPIGAGLEASAARLSNHGVSYPEVHLGRREEEVRDGTEAVDGEAEAMYSDPTSAEEGTLYYMNPSFSLTQSVPRLVSDMEEAIYREEEEEEEGGARESIPLSTLREDEEASARWGPEGSDFLKTPPRAEGVATPVQEPPSLERWIPPAETTPARAPQTPPAETSASLPPDTPATE